MFDWFFNLFNPTNGLLKQAKPTTKLTKIAKEDKSEVGSVEAEQAKLDALLDETYLRNGLTIRDVTNDVISWMFETNSRLSNKYKDYILNADKQGYFSQDGNKPGILDMYLIAHSLKNDPVLAEYLDNRLPKTDNTKGEPTPEEKADLNRAFTAAYDTFIPYVAKKINSNKGNLALANLSKAFLNQANAEPITESTDQYADTGTGNEDTDNLRKTPEALHENQTPEAVALEKEEDEKRKKRFNSVNRRLRSLFAEQPAMRRAFTVLLKNQYDIATADAPEINKEVLKNLPKELRSYVDDAATKTSADYKADFNRGLNNSTVKLQSGEEVRYGDLIDRHEALRDLRNLLFPGRATTSADDLKDLLDRFDSRIKELGEDAVAVYKYKERVKYDAVKNLYDAISDGKDVKEFVAKDNAAAYKKKITDEANSAKSMVLYHRKGALDNFSKQQMKQLAADRANAFRQLEAADIPEEQKKALSKIIRGEFNVKTSEIMDAYGSSAMDGMDKEIPESAMSKYTAQLLSEANFNGNVKLYNQLSEQISDEAKQQAADTYARETGLEASDIANKLTDTISLYELANATSKDAVAALLQNMMRGLDREVLKQAEKETGVALPRRVFKTKEAEHVLNEGAMREFFSMSDPIMGPKFDLDATQSHMELLEKRKADYQKRLEKVVAGDTEHEGLSESELRAKIDDLDKKLEADKKTQAQLKDEIRAEDPAFLSKEKAKSVTNIEDAEVKPAYPNKKVIEIDGYWFPVKVNPITGDKEPGEKPLPEPVIIEPTVYKVGDEDSFSYYLKGSNNPDEAYLLDAHTGKINDVPHTGISGEKVGTYREWLDLGEMGRSPKQKQEPEVKQPEAPKAEEAPKEQEPKQPEAPKEEPKQEPLDALTPTQEENNLATESGFYFGIQKTASFFKFAHSEDNYGDYNIKREKDESKLIESPDAEDFKYNPNTSEQSAAQDAVANEEFSMEKLGKVLKVIKDESEEKWGEIVKLIEQSSPKSGDDLAKYVQLWANNNWNGEEARRIYNEQAVPTETRNHSYFWKMFKNNVWPQLQNNPSVVNVVKKLNKNRPAEETDVKTNEYKNV